MKNHSKEKKRGSLATKIILVVCATVIISNRFSIKWCTITDPLGSTDNDDGSGREQR